MKAYEVNSENITEVDTKQVYEWIKTGVWSLKDFQTWYVKTFMLNTSCVIESLSLIPRYASDE